MRAHVYSRCSYNSSATWHYKAPLDFPRTTQHVEKQAVPGKGMRLQSQTQAVRAKARGDKLSFAHTIHVPVAQGPYGVSHVAMHSMYALHSD